MLSIILAAMLVIACGIAGFFIGVALVVLWPLTLVGFVAWLIFVAPFGGACGL